MKRDVIFILFLAFTHIGFQGISFGQRTTISTWSGSDKIMIRSLEIGNNSLNFNVNSGVLTANSGLIHIGKEDNNSAVFEIEAPSDAEIVINMEYTPFLAKERDFTPDQSIPIVLYMSYNNQNAVNETIAKEESIDIPSGITSITIPVISQYTYALIPTSSEFGESMEMNKSIVYLFVYGTLGPVGSVSAGEYSAQISIHVNISGGTI
ncbi:hypothetical protein [uncultured Algoriphagus sp.]|uniref:hypothetical protein n=1 Tax=uncultured Algoriphagus sp. TaxID=417365 RepID=UPI002591DF48|nr:hypothetical protein [uncultured Algoriphagus sp.]